MNNLEKLIRDHAYWSDERRKLKQMGCDEMNQCTSLGEAFDGIFRSGQTCLKSLYDSWRDEMLQGSSVTFEEVYAESLEEDGICIHCQNVRKLKRERIQAGRKLGGIRAAMTRIGRRLQWESGDD